MTEKISVNSQAKLFEAVIMLTHVPRQEVCRGQHAPG